MNPSRYLLVKTLRQGEKSVVGEYNDREVALSDAYRFQRLQPKKDPCTYFVAAVTDEIKEGYDVHIIAGRGVALPKTVDATAFAEALRTIHSFGEMATAAWQENRKLRLELKRKKQIAELEE